MKIKLKLIITALFITALSLYPEKPEVFVQLGHSDEVNSVAFSPDGKYIVSGSSDKTLKLWEVSTGKEIRTFTGHSEGVTSVAFSPDGKYFISGSGDKTVKLWEVSSGKEIRTFFGHSNWVCSVSFSPDGKYVLSGSGDETVKLWEVSSGKEIRTFSGHSNSVESVAFSPDGEYALSGSEDGTLKLWEVSSGKEIRTFSGHSNSVESVAFSPDGKYVLSGSWDKTVKLWEVSSGKEIRTFFGHSNWVCSVSFSPDGKYVLSGSRDGMKLWEVSSGKEIRTFFGHSNWVCSVSFSPDGKYALSGSGDSTTRLWDIATGKEIAQFVSFDDGEWICITPEGYFNASPNGAKHLNVRVGNRVYSMDNFYEIFYRPDIVIAKIEGQDVSKLVDRDLQDGFKLPPEVEIELETVDGTYRGETEKLIKDVKINDKKLVNVKIKAEDIGGGVKGIRLYQNGKIVGEKIVKEKDKTGDLHYEKIFTIPVIPGNNELKAVGFSEDWTESYPYIVSFEYSTPLEERPTMYLLAIGIDKYKNSRYNLKHCIDDTEGFIDTITPAAKNIFKEVKIIKLYNENATRENILKAFDEILKEIKPSDVFTFYYSGHGIALDIKDNENKNKLEFYYVLHEVTQMTDEEKVKNYGFSGDELKGYIEDNRMANKQVVFIDACSSGAIEYSFRGAAEESALARLNRVTGTAIVAATESGQEAKEVDALGHGLFTYVLIDGLSGKASSSDGSITVNRLVIHVEDKMKEVSIQFGEEQYPIKFLSGQDFAIGVR